jgi:hypothetical protein
MMARKATAEAIVDLPNTAGESVTPSDRYFPATILGGHLHVRGLPDWGPWNPSRLECDDEAFVDILLSRRQADRKVRTREELEAVMKEPKRAPTREVWMHESLVDEARRLWEQRSTIAATMRSRWIRLPPTWKPNPASHSTSNITNMVGRPWGDRGLRSL